MRARVRWNTHLKEHRKNVSISFLGLKSLWVDSKIKQLQAEFNTFSSHFRVLKKAKMIESFTQSEIILHDMEDSIVFYSPVYAYC